MAMKRKIPDGLKHYCPMTVGGIVKTLRILIWVYEFDAVIIHEGHVSVTLLENLRLKNISALYNNAPQFSR